MIVEFLARQWKWHMMLHLLGLIESTGFANRLSGSDRGRTHSMSNIKSINNSNCSQDRQLNH